MVSAHAIDTTSNSKEENLTADNAPRQLPPRLQHSPSLPNIRFTPHSGHQPSQLSPTKTDVDVDGDRPKTPPQTDVSAALNFAGKSLQHRETQSIDDVASYLRQKAHLPKKTHRRRATSKLDLGQALLTPPLTPSSSMKTTSTVGPAIEGGEDQEREINPAATRFLSLHNISRDVSSDILRAHIIDALLSGYSKTSCVFPSKNANSRMEAFDERAVKGLFLRCHKTDGMILLAFWDIRHAEIAQRILSSSIHGPLSACITESITTHDCAVADSQTPCRFVTADELVEITGSSAFLDSTNSSFQIAVEDESVCGGTDIARIVDDRSDGEDISEGFASLTIREKEQRHGVAGRECVDLNLLNSLLNSFGDVKSVGPSYQTDPPDSGVFTVEYYSIIDAITAYRALDGHDLFGMKIKVFERDMIIDEANLSSWASKPPAQPGITTEPYPSSVDNSATLGTPGYFSQMRRSFYEGPHPRPMPRDMLGQEHYISSNLQLTTPSPVVLYTTTPPELVNSSGPYFPGLQGVTVPSIHFHQPNEALGHFNPPSGLSITDPSRAYASQDIPISEYPPSVYPAGYYYPRPSPTPDSSRVGFFSSPSPYSMGRDQVNLTPMMAPFPSRAYGYYGGISGPVTPTVGGASHPWPQFPTNAPHHPSSQDWGFLETVHGLETSTQITRSTRGSPARTSPNRLQGSTPFVRRSPLHQSRTSPSQVPPERNQLNLSKIEDGQDTRTTVMIKNIPNKMSDKDLIAYIGNVCPRRIDFLYLRMDFQNGCNVGYAFVNFITVQDLLLFAREKLGEKWNMFASEKVLQMSYANYQGKEALVEKFKNSCIMDERESWRPKIFYSEPGPEQGLPESFPSPTHLRRKERSSYNRGALYVPGVGHHGRTSSLYHGNGGTRNGHGSRDGRGERYERHGGRRGRSDGDEGKSISGSGAFGSKYGKGRMG